MRLSIQLIWTLFALLLLSKIALAQETYTISGYITDKSNGEALIGATVYDKISQKGTVSNYYGFYSITLPANAVEIRITYAWFFLQKVA